MFPRGLVSYRLGGLGIAATARWDACPLPHTAGFKSNSQFYGRVPAKVGSGGSEISPIGSEVFSVCWTT